MVKRKAWFFLGATILFNIMLIFISRYSVYFSEFYAAKIYPLFSHFTARIMNIAPFSVAEILLFVLIPSLLACLIFLIIKLIREKGERVKIGTRAAYSLITACSTILLLYNLGCGINYQRLPFSHYSGLTVTGYDDNMLLEVINSLITELEPLCGKIETSETGAFTMDEYKLKTISRESMERLGKIYPCLENTYYPSPKPAIASELMSSMLICGIFSPFTYEANYNNIMPISEKPFTICHELSHLSGFMREDEANFIAFLACRESGDIDFLYSGYKSALTYAVIAYGRSASENEYFDMYNRIPEQVQLEFSLTNDYWKPYRDTTVSNTASAVNDAYLKANSQEDGTKSYGRFVDLLIADYYDKNR